VAVYGRTLTKEYENTLKGIIEFLSAFKKELPSALCIFDSLLGLLKRHSSAF
jgi:hypothetical protein